MGVDEETLMAFADGELAPEEAARVESAIAADPALAARVERLREVRAALRRTYDPVLGEPIPDRLQALLSQTNEPENGPANIVDLAAARARKTSRFSAPAWAAIAASAVLGVLVGRMAAPEALFVSAEGRLIAGAPLERALDHRLSADADAGPTRIGLSFQTRDGGYCRTFTHESGVSGLACRDGVAWLVRVAVQETPSASGYRQAAAPAPAVLEAVDALIEGEPLDAAAEQRARDNNWR